VEDLSIVHFAEQWRWANETEEEVEREVDLRWLMVAFAGGVLVVNWGGSWPVVLLSFSVFSVFLVHHDSVLPLLCFFFYF
jgi:hypothetical protein